MRILELRPMRLGGARTRAAQWIERAVEDGRAGSYGEVARALGLTESRIAQVTALLGLVADGAGAGPARGGRVGIREAIRVARDAILGTVVAKPG